MSTRAGPFSDGSIVEETKDKLRSKDYINSNRSCGMKVKTGSGATIFAHIPIWNAMPANIVLPP